MAKNTPLTDKHLEMGAKLVDFGGWDMPLHYGSQLEEHRQVREDAGMFDVSHMTVVDLEGERVREFLRHLLANNVDKLKAPGKALYGCMLNEQGGIIDDLIVYFMNDHWFRVVVNAATHDKDLAWMVPKAEDFGVQVREREDLAMIAVQGPNARIKTHATIGEIAQKAETLEPFFAKLIGGVFVARTGYTGEDGYELILPAADAPVLWEALYANGIQPIGLGARDTLRLEAGMSLYGTDMDETTTPLESALGWTVAWEPAEREFIGRAALEAQRAEGVGRKLVGLILEGKGVLRNHQKVVVEGVGEGEVTSGSFAPTLGKSIAFARVPVDTGERCSVEIRGKLVPARVVKPPFVRNGRPCF